MKLFIDTHTCSSAKNEKAQGSSSVSFRIEGLGSGWGDRFMLLHPVKGARYNSKKGMLKCMRFMKFLPHEHLVLRHMLRLHILQVNRTEQWG